jgi:hypothetical protein
MKTLTAKAQRTQRLNNAKIFDIQTIWLFTLRPLRFRGENLFDQ